MIDNPKKYGFITATRVGAANREIEKSISHVVSGKRGATGEAIGFAKRRQALLASRPFKQKNSA
jgi:hypothetical protein